MTKQQLTEIFKTDCTETDKDGNLVIKGTPTDIINWISEKFCQPPEQLFSKAFTGMHDKNGKPIHEGDTIKLYYKGEYFVCKIVYDPKHAAFFVKWPDGYINHYFMNGSSYEVL
jgi:hypothetical protein